MTFTPTTTAEQRLLDTLHALSRIQFGTGDRPSAPSDDTKIRGSFLRHLMVNERLSLSKGVRLCGAWISGVLDLHGVELGYGISLTRCHLDEPVEMMNAKLRGVHISDCHLNGLNAENAQFDG